METTGKIVFLNPLFGGGFIRADDGRDIIVLARDVPSAISPGTRVSFLIVKSDPWPTARRVRLIELKS